MNQYKIYISAPANRDIETIGDAIFRFSFDQNLAQKWRNLLLASIYSLRLFPARFETYRSNYRRCIVEKKYKIIYRIDTENNTVIIVRIIRTENKDLL